MSGPERLRIAAAVVVVLAVAALALAEVGGKGAVRKMYPEQFAAGEGRAIADRACLMCHTVTLVTQQAKDSTGWRKTLTQMQAWGAPFSAAESDTLHAYLLRHYGPRPPKR